MAKTRKKTNNQYAARATNVVLNVFAAVGTSKGLDAVSRVPFMQDDLVKLGISGGLTLAGMAGGVLPGNEMIRSVATGVASGAATKLTDNVITKLGIAGMGNTENGGSGADDYLNLYTTDVDMEGIEDVQIGNAPKEIMIK